MEIQVPPGASLTKEQRTEMAKGFEFLGLMAEGGRARKRKGLPLVVPKVEVPKLLRGCGRAPTAADLKELMTKVPNEGIQLEDFLSLYETAAEKPLLNEYQLFDALRTLDLTKTDTLEPKGLKEILHGFGDAVTFGEVDKILSGLPRDGLGRVKCKDIARKLMKGPSDIPHL
ncbi:unnamed protein product [Cladocopium goreaui]|uniref:Myosin regulatory light chain n=1 Tax=Cladocopium goreaui TaxID=2562237 RepID=A0A9P1D1K8_9DINO|nr:unnamed protein product [Cladocopium goreaui]CAI4015443.1 unnamed protein product [Cladocopium goreaui]